MKASPEIRTQCGNDEINWQTSTKAEPRLGFDANATQGASMNSGGTRSTVNSPLVNYALQGLQKCWLPEHGRWSHVYHLDGRDQPNESLAQSDVYYTLNVLLGLARVPQVPNNVAIAATFERNVGQLLTLPVAKYAFGMALWAAAELKLEIPPDVVRHLNSLLSDKKSWFSFRAQDLGMILTGIVAQAKAGRKEWYKFSEGVRSAAARSCPD